jgi:hypothetical protein
LTKSVDRVLESFELITGLKGLQYEDMQRGAKSVRVIYLSQITDRFWSILNDCIAKEASNDEGFHVTLKIRTSDTIINSPEARLLLKVMSESQNINQHSFSGDFFERYILSVTGAETQIISQANHVVTGRRGAGKSMLLLYCLKVRQRDSLPSAWIDMQTFSGRTDEEAVADVLVDLLYNLSFPDESVEEALDLRRRLESTTHSVAEIRKLCPKLRRILATVSKQTDLFIFLDDLHVFNQDLQHILLDVLYSVSRGNKVFLKISAIENLVRTYNAEHQSGMEIPQDVQRLGLDYNLTTPDKATSHIESILDSHARYAALPSIRRLCSSADVLPRLTWVSAGVPRDAINLFAQSMLKASAAEKKRVTVSNVNMAASENLSFKLRELQADASASAARLSALLERIRNFCVVENRQNALLVEIKSGDDGFKDVMSLVQLRLLHVISEGITPKEAGTKFMALILDYGLYTGVRAAASVELFNKDTTSVSYKDLRKIKIFRP